MPAYGLIDQAIAGLQFGQQPRVDSAVAGENIPWGAPVFTYIGDDGRCWKAHQDTVNGLFSGVLVTANSISGSITITPNGGVATPVAFGPVVFATDSPTTITAIINAINVALTAALGAGVATASLGATALTINVTGKGIDITAFTATVTLGGSQATFSSTFTTLAKFSGIALFINTGGRDFGAAMQGGSAALNSAQYLAGMAVNILYLGYIWAVTAVAVLQDQPVYVILAPGATQGQFTNVAGTNNYAISAFYRSSQNSQGLAIVETKGMA